MPMLGATALRSAGALAVPAVMRDGVFQIVANKLYPHTVCASLRNEKYFIRPTIWQYFPINPLFILEFRMDENMVQRFLAWTNTLT